MPYEPMGARGRQLLRDRDTAMQMLGILAERNGGEVAFTDHDMEAARDGRYEVVVQEDPVYMRTVIKAVKRP